MTRPRALASTFLAALCCLASVGIADAEVLPLGPGDTGVRMSAGGDLIVTVSEVRLDSVEIEGRGWAVVRVPHGHNLVRAGHPALPFLATEYLLGATGAIDLEMVDSQVLSVDLSSRGFAGVAPSKGHFDRGTDPDSIPWTFDPRVYGADASWPAEDAWVDRPFIAGPLRGQGLRLPVARWNPLTNVVEVVVEATYRVRPVETADNPRIGGQRALSGPFVRLAEHAVNAAEWRRDRTDFSEAGRLLVIAYDDFVDEVEPLAAWQNQVGYPTQVVPLSTIGSSATQIHQYIQTEYDAGDLSWIILVGDAQQIPTLSGVNEGAPCDPCYVKLEGADNRPDAAISRISAQTGAEVTVQVDKFLTYERYPDTGSAAAWYSKAFGVAGNDTGGSPSYADWERMDFLKDDLLAPAYHYTEFSELYHDPSEAQVAAAVNDGRSLGLYIGHGGETYWVTSGFSVNDVNSMLTNADALPVIWDVACVNGRFTRSGGDCFAEAWLKKPGGGAVSFEAATTNESWVPPCDGQRGIIDALRLGTAFTTGGQQLAGKLYCMDVNGDSNSSEGTRWMEQSTLFGVCTTWTRTSAPVSPDEPTDYTVSGGIATLTVTVGGQPLALAGSAIVSFYTRDPELQLLGSGLVDASGVVHAAVTDDPTHCHIHGANLIPQEFELAARPEGQITLDAEVYTCASEVGVRVGDSNVPNADPTVADTVDVTLETASESVVVTLTETDLESGFYEGGATLGVDLAVAHGETLTARYIDADDGAGGVGIERTDTAALDCIGPAVVDGPHVSDVGADTALVTWTTDEAGTSRVTVWPDGTVFTGEGIDTSHTVQVDGLAPCSDYTVTVDSTDAVGNVGAGIDSSPFTTLEQTVALDDDVESGPGDWTVDSAVPGGSGTTWAVVSSGAHSPTHAWFTSNPNSVKDDRLVAGPFAIGGGTTTLSFWHSYDLESGYDGAVLEVSTDGASWDDVTTVGTFTAGGYDDTIPSGWSNPLATRPAWTGDSGDFVHTTVELSGLADAQLWLRFRIGCDSMVSDQGWWVDDVLLETTDVCIDEQPIFGDGFESGDTNAWAAAVN